MTEIKQTKDLLVEKKRRCVLFVDLVCIPNCLDLEEAIPGDPLQVQSSSSLLCCRLACHACPRLPTLLPSHPTTSRRHGGGRGGGRDGEGRTWEASKGPDNEAS